MATTCPEALELAQKMSFNLGTALVALTKASCATPAQQEQLLEEALSAIEAEIELKSEKPKKKTKKTTKKKTTAKKASKSKPTEPPIRNLDEEDEDDLPEDLDDVEV